MGKSVGGRRFRRPAIGRRRGGRDHRGKGPETRTEERGQGEPRLECAWVQAICNTPCPNPPREKINYDATSICDYHERTNEEKNAKVN